MFLHSLHTQLTLFQVCTVQPSIKNNVIRMWANFTWEVQVPSQSVYRIKNSNPKWLLSIWLSFEKHNEKFVFKNSEFDQTSLTIMKLVDLSIIQYIHPNKPGSFSPFSLTSTQHFLVQGCKTGQFKYTGRDVSPEPHSAERWLSTSFSQRCNIQAGHFMFHLCGTKDGVN